jgi:hypothetical protein
LNPTARLIVFTMTRSSETLPTLLAAHRLLTSQKSPRSVPSVRPYGDDVDETTFFEEEGDVSSSITTTWNNATATAAASVPHWIGFSIKTLLGISVVLYALNQASLLPLPLSAVVSKALFWPTMPIAIGKRLGRWSTEIDDTVVMGGAPFGFWGIPEKLQEKYGVSTGGVHASEDDRQHTNVSPSDSICRESLSRV